MTPSHTTTIVRAVKTHRGNVNVITVLEHPVAGPLAFLVLGGLVSLKMGIDISWDLRNYHFYDPWAWLHNRWGQDYAPAQLQSYYSPFLDLPFFALAQTSVPASVICFVMGMWFGAGAYFFARITRIVIRDVRITHENRALLAILGVALTGAAGVSQIGSTMNEWATTTLVLAALFILIRSNATATGLTTAAAAMSGFILGAAVGLKLTAGVFAAAAFMALLSWCWTQRARIDRAIVFAVAGLAGFVVCYGYWGFVLWRQFRNPFFPYFNGFFKSPYSEPRAFLDRRFFPDSFFHWIVLPFRIARHNTLLTEASMRDPRLALLGLSALSLLGVTAARAWTRGRVQELFRERMPASVLLLSVFAVVSYIAWFAMFSIYRYVIPLELIASLLLILAVRSCLPQARYREPLIAVFCLLIVAATAPPDWGRARLHAGRYVDVGVPVVPVHSLVVMVGGEPMGYVVPFIGRGSRVVRPQSNFTDPTFTNSFQRAIAATLAGHEGPLFQIRLTGENDVGEEAVLRDYELRRDDVGCLPIRSNLEPTPRRLTICPLRRSTR
jgi:hypothetical protein